MFRKAICKGRLMALMLTVVLLLGSTSMIYAGYDVSNYDTPSINNTEGDTSYVTENLDEAPGDNNLTDIDLDDLITLTPEVGIDEDGNVYVIHPDVDFEEEDEDENVYVPGVVIPSVVPPVVPINTIVPVSTGPRLESISINPVIPGQGWYQAVLNPSFNAEVFDYTIVVPENFGMISMPIVVDLSTPSTQVVYLNGDIIDEGNLWIFGIQLVDEPGPWVASHYVPVGTNKLEIVLIPTGGGSDVTYTITITRGDGGTTTPPPTPANGIELSFQGNPARFYVGQTYRLNVNLSESAAAIFDVDDISNWGNVDFVSWGHTGRTAFYDIRLNAPGTVRFAVYAGYDDAAIDWNNIDPSLFDYFAEVTIQVHQGGTTPPVQPPQPPTGGGRGYAAPTRSSSGRTPSAAPGSQAHTFHNGMSSANRAATNVRRNVSNATTADSIISALREGLPSGVTAEWSPNTPFNIVPATDHVDGRVTGLVIISVGNYRSAINFNVVIPALIQE